MGNEKPQKSAKEAEPKNKILIPLLSMQENDKNFLNTAVADADLAILLFVVDTQSMAGKFGFASASISKGTAVIKDAKMHIVRKKKKVKEIVDWGDTATKIKNISILQGVKKIVLKQQSNQWFGEIVKELGKGKVAVEII